MGSRGDAVSAYSPEFSNGSKVYSSNMKAAFLSGSIVSGNGTVYAVAHGLSAVPKSVIVTTLATAGQISADVRVALAAASAANSANIYIGANNASGAAVKYAAYVQI